MKSQFKVGGYFRFQAVNPDGSIAWEKKAVPNGVPDAAINDLLETQFRAGTQKTSWFCGLINNAGFSALSANDTAASHAGWTELTDYSQATRPQWSPGAAASKQLTNSTPMAFSINTSVSIKGAFLISNSTKSGTTGVLFCTAAFSAVQSLTSGQTLNVTYVGTGSSTT